MVKAAETEERSEAREVRSDDAFYCGGRETHNFIPHRRYARREVKALENVVASLLSTARRASGGNSETNRLSSLSSWLLDSFSPYS